jgi:16S rRNA (cytidine1402-2'-O)-methyltransferase
MRYKVIIGVVRAG